MHSITVVKCKHSSILGRSPLSPTFFFSIWLNCRGLRSPFLQLYTLCNSMSSQHLGLTTQFPSQGMGWPRPFTQVNRRERKSNRDRLCSNQSPWPLSVRDFCKKSDTYKYNKPFFLYEEVLTKQFIFTISNDLSTDLYTSFLWEIDLGEFERAGRLS